MIRLPSPPKKMTVPAPPIDFLNRFNEIITFQQNLSSALQQQQIFNEQRTTVSTLEAEQNAEAKSWFNG